MIQNRAFVLTIPLSAALASVLAVAGCTHGASNGAADAAADAKAGDGGVALASRPPLRPFRHGGIAGIAFNAAHEAQLTEDQQKSIEEIQAKLAAPDPAQRTVFTDYQAHLNAGTKAGKFDEAQLKADYAAIDAIRHGEEDREAAALNELHALLTPEQRTTVINSVKAKEAQIEMQKPPPMPDGGVDDRIKATLSRMTTDLTLDASQQKRVSDLLVKDERQAASSFPERKDEQKKRADEFITSFEQASYDATKTENADAGPAPHEQMDKEVHFLTQLMAILKPDQREKLAAERSPATPGGHHMMPGMGGPGGAGGPGMPVMRPGGPGAPGGPVIQGAPPPPSHS